MLSSEKFYDSLVQCGIDFFTGVPDSLLKEICACISVRSSSTNHIIAANEGAAIALAAGTYLATGKPGFVYLQNSGLGNIVNPLISMADPRVYAVPMLIMIGWRGEPGVADEPQHRKQGEITPAMLDSMDIAYEVLPTEMDEANKVLTSLIEKAKTESGPVALLVKKGTFDSFALPKRDESNLVLNREGAAKMVIDSMGEKDIMVSTTGKTSREVFEYRVERGDGHERDFLTVGSMGHASQIALGIALKKPDRSIYCLDGDGAVLMHMGALPIIGSSKLDNFKHVVINNGAHDSVGGQPTVGFDIDLLSIAKASGYEWTARATEPKDIATQLEKLKVAPSPALLEIMVSTGARKDLGRPTKTPIENKTDFMKFLNQ